MSYVDISLNLNRINNNVIFNPIFIQGRESLQDDPNQQGIKVNYAYLSLIDLQQSGFQTLRSIIFDVWRQW